MTFTLQGRLQDLVASYSSHLSNSAREALSSLPPGWLELVRNMVDRVEQVLGEAESGTFRWTDFDRKRGRLIASWSGASESEVLIDQITEEASDEAANSCVECGSSALMGVPYEDGPRCLYHGALKSGRNRAEAWKLTKSELVDALSERRKTADVPSPKAIAAALPMLLEFATDYYRYPDNDAPAITQQIQEAFDRLNRHLRKLGSVEAAHTDR